MTKKYLTFSVVTLVLVAFLGISLQSNAWSVNNSTPPTQPVKLVFIHHSVGEDWLADDKGGLGLALLGNNYFVSDTNYGWGPDGIGDRTDIPNWTEWFTSLQTPTYMGALLNESSQNSSYSRMDSDPGGENQIIMFKSCFPNSSLYGNPNDEPSADGDYTVGHAKYVYNQLLTYFSQRPDKLFIVVTAPPNSDGSLASNARAFNNWLVSSWLTGYTGSNVAVFDFYNVLTGPSNHHRLVGDTVEHTYVPGMNTSYYRTAPDNDHPTPTGGQKATAEFVGLLNVFYHNWVQGTGPVPPVVPPTPPVVPPTPPDKIVTTQSGWPKVKTAKRSKATVTVTITPAQNRSGVVQRQVCKKRKCRWVANSNVLWPASYTAATKITLQVKKGTQSIFRLVVPATNTGTDLISKSLLIKGK